MKKLVLVILTICILTSSFATVYAQEQEVYLEDIRIVYAKSYEEAKEALKGTEFDDYKILDSNLNKDTGENGVWLAYQVTTDIEQAITDISIMQMDGGYSEGNYQAMIEKSRNEYKEMGILYLDAVSYLIDAEAAGDFLAEAALRQLNFYYDPDSGLRLGELFIEGIGADGLATMFLEGNKYALDNIRSLIAMGTAYNENGKNYLELVEEAVKEMTDNPMAFEDEELDELAVYVAAGITTFKGMFEEYETVRDDIDLTDEEITDLELNYIEYAAIATLFEDVEYLGDKTLYEFCKKYTYDEDNLRILYPLVAALNPGQRAMTEVAHYYDVVRYGICAVPEEVMNEELEKLEEIYEEDPFDIYTGVDRSIYEGTFALTTEAERANISTKDGLLDHLLGTDSILTRCLEGVRVAMGTMLFAFSASIKNSFSETVGAEIARRAAEISAERIAYFEANVFAKETFTYVWPEDMMGFKYKSIEELLNNIAIQLSDDFPELGAMSVMEKYRFLVDNADNIGVYDMVIDDLDEAYYLGVRGIKIHSAKDAAVQTTQQYAQMSSLINYATVAINIIGGALMLSSAISLGLSIYSYYNPSYDEIPSSMVDLVETVDGDRYIKYDAVTRIDTDKYGNHQPADLNAFKAQRWNAMYITKSYEAGKPLLENFIVSYDNNAPGEKYMPVHRFGEDVCYNLNKYNFNSRSASIYLSVKQSDNQKAAFSKVPAVVGSLVSNSYYIFAGVGGLVLGAGAMFLVKFFVDKRKQQ